MTVSDKKLAANRTNARKGGRPTRSEDAETDRMAREILQRHGARAAKLAAKKLLERIKAGDTPAPATPTVAAKATDDIDSLVAQLIARSDAKSLGDVTWHQVYNFCKLMELEGSPKRTKLFRAWQKTQPLPEIPGWNTNQEEET